MEFFLGLIIGLIGGGAVVYLKYAKIRKEYHDLRDTLRGS